MHSTVADAVKTQRNEWAIFGKYCKYVRNLDVFGIGSRIYYNSLLGHGIMEKTNDKSDNGTSDTDDHITGRFAFTESGDDQRRNDPGNGIAKA